MTSDSTKRRDSKTMATSVRDSGKEDDIRFKYSITNGPDEYYGVEMDRNVRRRDEDTINGSFATKRKKKYGWKNSENIEKNPEHGHMGLRHETQLRTSK